MATKVSGRFYFKLTANGNLLGEWSNRDSIAAQPTSTESADFDVSLGSPKTRGTFVGSYRSTWQENGVAVFATLKIDLKPHVPDIFTLTWHSPSKGKPIFNGEGMLCDDILVGDYHSF